MLRVYYSNRTEALLDALVERVRAQRTMLFDPVHIVVPNQNMETFVKLSLARLMGVCGNVRFRRLGELTRASRGTADCLLTALFDPALIGEPALEPLRTYLEAGGTDPSVVDRRRVELAGELARLFGEYEESRPELIECWRAGLFATDETSRDLESWQRRLWLMTSGSSGETAADIPSALHLFGVSYMKRALMEMLARVESDVYVYTLNPCQEIWEALTVPMPLGASAQRYERRGRDLGPGEVFSVEDPFRLMNAGEMAPLRLWGRAGRENLRLLNALTGCALEPRIRGPEPTTLLEQIQRDIALRKPARESIPKELDFENDDSIVILECAGVRRELEAIATEIWRLVDQRGDDAAAEPLRFNDIAVILVPADAERYQALVGSVFAEMHGLPYNIVDLPLRGESRLVEAVELLLALPSSRFTREDILRFATHPIVLASVPAASRDKWLSWCRALGIVHGADRRDHDDTYIGKDVFNWDQGLKRLALGTFMSVAVTDELFGDGDDTYLPEEVPRDQRASAGHFGLLVRSLVNDAREAGRVRMTVPGWMDFMSAFTGTYVRAHSPEDERMLARCLRAMDAIASTTLDGKKVSYVVAHELVRRELRTLTGSRGKYLVDGVVVSSFLPMRAIPFKVIFVAGLGEGRFPAAERRNHLDLRSAQRRAGDVSVREQDRYLFLETLLSAREKLYLSYVARDELTGEPRQPSSLVMELVETLERSYVPHVPRRRYPLLRADDADALRTSSAALGERRARALGESLRAHLGLETLPDLGSLELPARVRDALGCVEPPEGRAVSIAPVSLAAIRRFLECPLQGSAQFLLRLRDTSEDGGGLDGEELFQAAPQQRAALLRETFRRGGDAATYDALAHRYELRGERPTGIFGRSERARHLETLDAWRRALVAVAGTEEIRLITRAPAACLVEGTVVELGPSSLLISASPRLSIRLCSQRRSRFHPRRESLHGFLDHVFHAAAGLVLGEPYAFVAINAPPKDEPSFERFSFAPISRETATGYLAAILEDMRARVHDYLLPCEVALGGLAPMPWTKTSSRFGPVSHPEDFAPLPEPRAREIVDRRFGLYFESLGEAS